jgi:hypothetical protein
VINTGSSDRDILSRISEQFFLNRAAVMVFINSTITSAGTLRASEVSGELIADAG